MRTLSFVLVTLCLASTDALAQKRPVALADLYALKRVADPQVSPDGKLVVFQVANVDLGANKSSTNLWISDTVKIGPPRRLTSSIKADRHPRWSPDGTKILFESTRSGENQLWVIDLAGGEARQLTTLSTGAGTAIWSPDGTHIAFVSAVFPEFSEKPFKESDALNKKRLEETEKGPVKARVFTRLFYRHWDEYVEDKRQHLFVLSADGGEPRDVTPGNRDGYPNSTTFSVGDDFTFTPDGKHLVFAAAPASDESWSTNYDLCRVAIDNAATNWETLTKNPAADNGPRFSPDGKRLAWRAQKKAGYEADKWDILVADCSANGDITGEPKNLTAEKDVSVNEFTWRPGEQLVFVVDENGAHTVYSVTLGGKISVGVGTFGANGKTSAYIQPTIGTIAGLNCSKDGLTWVCALSRLDHPAHVNGAKFSAEDTSVTVGIVADPNYELLNTLDRQRPESVKVKVEGGDMQMWVLKPPGFDDSKKWPVAYLVHGGPQSAWEDGWSFRWNPQLWAAQGYVVVLPNPRGSTGFGQKFVDQISGDWGGKCYRDLVAGLDYVEALPYVDKDRIGTAGASFGGYMMNWFAVNDIAKRFKCQINHCSVWNFESMWGTTDELWFDEFEHGGLPWEKPEAYAHFSPHKKAGNLGKNKVPMLVIHNDYDFRCPIGQGHELFNALQRQKVPSRFVNFPDEGHWVLKPKNGERWHNEVFAWLKQYCPPGGK